MGNDALHYLTSTEMIVPRFLGTGSFLIRYFIGHTNKTYRRLNNFRDYF
jgi:hypothetical protein